MQHITHAVCCPSGEEFNDWLHIIRSEYAEMPGLHLSKLQAQRLWGLDGECCQQLFETLESAHVLRRTANGSYVKAGGGCR